MDYAERQRFADVVADCTPTMIGLAYLLTGSQPTAERTLRRALAHTARHWHELDEPAESFIFTAMCRNETSRWRRLVRRLASFASSSRDDPLVVESAGDELAAAMRQALLRLPPRERVVVVLLHHEQLTLTETARVLDWSEAAVRRRIERAQARLRELLADLSTRHHRWTEPETVRRPA